MSTEVNPTAIDAPAPQQPAPVGNPITVTDAASRDLRAEKESEVRADKAAAEKKLSRFMPRRVNTERIGPRSELPDIETLIFKSAVNFPFRQESYRQVSTFVPNSQAMYAVISYMDDLMAASKRWTDNCMGWVPPFSQAYFGVLFYFQVLRAMSSVSLTSLDQEHALTAFLRLYPTNELWIPGPLVPFFKALSAFRPTEDDLFGSVSPTLPRAPGWSRANNFVIAGDSNLCLPNVACLLERLRSIINGANGLNVNLTANAALSDFGFNRLFDGPQRTAHMWNATVPDNADNHIQFSTPGMQYVLGGNLLLWKGALASFDQYSLPPQMDIANATPENTWLGVMRFNDGQHVWFTEIAPMMARYAQFFRGSRSLEDCSPVGSVANAVKLQIAETGTNIFDQLVFTTAATPAPAYYAHVRGRRIVTNGSIALRDVPNIHKLSGITTMFNLYWSDSSLTALRVGPFWRLAPDTETQERIEVLPGVASSIARDYHSDARLDRI
jgi:hypothetical protein